MGYPSRKEVCASNDVDGERMERARRSLLDDARAARLADTFRALGDPTRVRIISALLSGELCVYELADAVGASQSAVSHQLATLRGMRLVRFRKEGRHVYYALDDEHISQLFHQGLDHISHE